MKQAGCTKSRIAKYKITHVNTPTSKQHYIHTHTHTHTHTRDLSASLICTACECVRYKHRDGVWSDGSLSDVDCCILVCIYLEETFLASPVCHPAWGEKTWETKPDQMPRRFSWVNSTLFQLMNKTVKQYKPIYRANKIKQMASAWTIFIHRCFREKKKKEKTHMQVF